MNNPNRALSAARNAWNSGRHLDCGRLISETLTEAKKVQWAAGILRFCRAHSSSVPAIDAVLALTGQANLWHQAHDAFDQVRDITLAAERSPTSFDRRLTCLLFVAENTAKVMFNASGSDAPFDEDSAWWLAPNLSDFLAAAEDVRLHAPAIKVLYAPLAENAA